MFKQNKEGNKKRKNIMLEANRKHTSSSFNFIP